MERSGLPASNHRDGVGIFPVTQWSIIAHAGERQSPQHEQALEALCRCYWRPVLAFVCSSGINEAEAKDVTQDFFASMIKHEAFASADPERGRFRSYLLASLRNFIASSIRHAGRQKRGGGVAFVSIDDASAAEMREMSVQFTPEQAFERKWAKEVFQRVLDRLAAEMAEAGNSEKFQLLKPTLVDGGSGSSYAEIAKIMATTENAVKTAVSRFRARFRVLFREEIASLVSDPRDVADELAHVIRSLT